MTDEAAFMAAFKRGDRAAMSDVYRLLVDDVATLVRRGFTLDRQGGGRVLGLGSPDDQRDVVQEVFTRAFSAGARSAYDGLSPLRPYVLRIAKNLMIDRLRRGGRVTTTSAFDDAGDIDELIDRDAPFRADESGAALDERRLQDATKGFTAALGEPERTVYRLRYVEGLAQHEVAAKMNVTRRFVRTAEDRLRAGLFAHLQGRGLADLVAGSGGAARIEARA